MIPPFFLFLVHPNFGGVAVLHQIAHVSRYLKLFCQFHGRIAVKLFPKYSKLFAVPRSKRYNVINSCARSMYAISILRSHGMCVPLLQQVFQSVVMSKLTYAAPAWWGFLTSADRQRIESFLRRGARSGLWESATTAEEVGAADETLFWKLRHCRHHVGLAYLLNCCHRNLPRSTSSGNDAIT